jgi:hypothetical protein
VIRRLQKIMDGRKEEKPRTVNNNLTLFLISIFNLPPMTTDLKKINRLEKEN